MERLVDTRLLATTFCCFLITAFYSLFLIDYVMPDFDNAKLSLAERVRSVSMGDSGTYGRYALGILEHGKLSDVSGQPILKHMPGLPMVVALSFRIFDSPRAFLLLQGLFFFVCMYFFLLGIKSRFPEPVLVLTGLIMVLHPLMVKHFLVVMSDLLFTSILLLIAVFVWKDNVRPKSFIYAGMLFGLATYVRESGFALMVVMGIAFILRDKRRYFKPVIVMGCVFVAVLSPWIIRNYMETGSFILLTTKGAKLFYSSSIPIRAKSYPFFTGGNSSGGRKVLLEGDGTAVDGLAVSEPKSQDSNLLLNALRNYASYPKEHVEAAIVKTIVLLDTPPMLGRLRSQTHGILIGLFDTFFYIFHGALILFGIVISFKKDWNPFFYLPYFLVAQYLQALFLWSEARYLMPLYPFLIVISLSWYWDKLTNRVYGTRDLPPNREPSSCLEQ